MALHNNPYDASHFKAVERKAREIQMYLENLVHEITKNASFSAVGADGFKFKDYPRLNKLMDEITKKSYQDLIGIFNKQTKDSWERGSEKTIQTLLGKIRGKEIRKVIRNSREINLKALEAFQNRKVGNFKLSDSVWNITKTFRDEMESALDLSIASGKSAQKISQEVRHLLKYPDKHFKRVRDKHGNLVASKNAQKFKSGQGVYRGSYKNAMRLARTENNIAYHTATNDKYQEFDFVVGIEIRLSNNPVHCPFCESMAGKYPKDFQFTSWHPQCRCTTIPILKTPEEIQEDNDAIAQGEDISKGSKNDIKEPPKAFQEYIQKHGDKMREMENPPYFFRDNLKYAKVDIGNETSSVKFKQVKVNNLPENILTNENSRKLFRIDENIIKKDEQDELIDYILSVNGDSKKILEHKHGKIILEYLGYNTDGKIINVAYGNADDILKDLTHQVNAKLSYDDLLKKAETSVLDNIHNNMQEGKTIQGYFGRLQGFDGDARIVDADVFDKMNGDDIVKIYRGLSGGKSQVDQYKFFDVFEGKGIYGDGTYFTDSQKSAVKYSKNANEGILEAKFSTKNLRIADFNELEKEFNEKVMFNYSSTDKEKYMKSLGEYATAKGYDAIKCSLENEYYYVILNRTKLWIKE